jgi:hypothetical protein
MKLPAVSFVLAGLLIAAPVAAQVTAQGPVAPATPHADPSPGHLPGLANDRVLRARANLEALLAGRVSTADLSPLELQDVIDLDRIARGVRADDRTTPQKCVDEEVRRNGGNPSRLAWQVIRLKCQ